MDARVCGGALEVRAVTVQYARQVVTLDSPPCVAQRELLGRGGERQWHGDSGWFRARTDVLEAFERLSLEHRRRRQGGRSPHYVAKLPHVAGPRLIEQMCQRIWRQRSFGAVELLQNSR